MNYYPISNCDALDNFCNMESTDVTQNQVLSQLTNEEYGYDPPFQYQYMEPSTSWFNTNAHALETQQRQTTDDQYGASQYIDNSGFLDYLLSPDQDHSILESNFNTHAVETQQQQVIGNKLDIPQISYEPNKYYELQSVYKSYILETPPCGFLGHKFGISLLSWEGEIYSLIVKKIGLGPIRDKLENIIYHSVVSNNFYESGGEDFSVIMYHLKKIFMSLIIREIENDEMEHPVQIRSGMLIGDLRNAAVHNSNFFDKLGEKCLDITQNRITHDIYNDMPKRLFTTTSINDFTKFVFNKKSHADKLNRVMVHSISNLKKRIIKFIANAEPKYIVSSFFGKFCGLYLQRQLLEEIKSIGNKISDSILSYDLFPGIRFSSEINLAISLYDTTGSIPTYSSSGLYNFVHQKVCEFREDICAKIKKFKFFYNDSSATVNEMSESDIETFSNKLMEYFKYASICSYREREKLLGVKKVDAATLIIKGTRKYNISCIKNIDMTNNYMNDGMYLSAIRNHNGFRHVQLEASFFMEMKQYMQSAKIDTPDFSHFYENLIHVIARTVSDKLTNLELELSSYVLIPGNDIHSIKQLILDSSYHLNQFNRVCENEIDLIMQCDSELLYGIPVLKCFTAQRSNISESSICRINPRLVKSKHSYSPELLLDIIISAISKLPSIFQLEINNADDRFFESSLFTNFNGTLISKKSLQELSTIGRDILHLVHENQTTIDILKSIVDEATRLELNLENNNVMRSIIISKDKEILCIVETIMFTFKEKIENLSRESIILSGKTITTPSEETAHELLDSFKTEITLNCFDSFSEICLNEYIRAQKNYIEQQSLSKKPKLSHSLKTDSM
ncbi:hypothetical protein [Candidatus Ichthyocystis sparus]|uniref:hypothetical protein n=1 Tax=Candidatus Ichthyocystis sparus TaxID=1561004 RepID=UPI000B82AA48|nr:hypothetical protein [Candidatus Ichthyocystis sparus]